MGLLAGQKVENCDNIGNDYLPTQMNGENAWLWTTRTPLEYCDMHYCSLWVNGYGNIGEGSAEGENDGGYAGGIRSAFELCFPA